MEIQRTLSLEQQNIYFLEPYGRDSGLVTFLEDIFIAFFIQQKFIKHP